MFTLPPAMLPSDTGKRLNCTGSVSAIGSLGANAVTAPVPALRFSGPLIDPRVAVSEMAPPLVAIVCEITPPVRIWGAVNVTAPPFVVRSAPT